MEICVENITRRFGNTVALDNVSFQLASERITGLVGPNGAGKTTLLRIMAAQDAPDCGDIRYDGVSAVDYPECIATKAVLMPDALPNTTSWRVWDYLDFFARANNLVGQQRIDKLNNVKQLCHLEALWDNPLNTLSKGMKQRVSLARVLLSPAPLLLLDEPAAGLDPRARIELRDIVRNVANEGRTLLVSSHILSELEDMCDEMLIMEAGRKVSHGPLIQLENENSAASNECTLLLEFQEVTPELTERLMALPRALSCIAEDRRRVKITTASQYDADVFMAALFIAHIPLSSFRASGRSLESLFINATDK